MEKINALIDKLQDLKNAHAPLQTLSYYTQLLYAEIMHAGNAAKQQAATTTKVSVILPMGVQQPDTIKNIVPVPAEAANTGKMAERIEFISEDYPAKTAEASKLPPKEEKAMEEIPVADIPEQKPTEAGSVQMSFDLQYSREAASSKPEKENTSSSLQKELNELMLGERPSLNELLKENKKELGHKLSESPVQDLRTAVGINDKFLFINELFRGDQDMYDRSIRTINGCKSLPDAEYWIERELKIKLGWMNEEDTVQQFYTLVRKRFSAI